MSDPHPQPASAEAEVAASPAAAAARAHTPGTAGRNAFRSDRMWSYFGPAFVASVAYIDPGNFATNILGGSQFGYRLLWVLLWSNAMAILIQYLAAKLGIVTGRTLPQSCRDHFSRRTSFALWVCAEISAVATDLAEFLGAALGLDLLLGPALQAHGFSATGSLFLAAAIATVAVFCILALDLAGFQWLERGIMFFVGVIGLCYGFEVFLVHPDWQKAFLATVIPTFDTGSTLAFKGSVYAAVGMLGATVMPHVIYLHSSLVQPRLKELSPVAGPAQTWRPAALPALRAAGRLRRDERCMAHQLGHDRDGRRRSLPRPQRLAHHSGRIPHARPAARSRRGGGLRGRSAVLGAFELDCRRHGRASHHRRLPRHPLSIFLRRLITVIPALMVIGVGWDPLKILIGSQVLLSFTLPAALIPLLLLTNRADVMGSFVSAPRVRAAGWVVATVIVALNAVLLVQLATG